MMAWSSCQFDCGMSCLPLFFGIRDPQIHCRSQKTNENGRKTQGYKETSLATIFLTSIFTPKKAHGMIFCITSFLLNFTKKDLQTAMGGPNKQKNICLGPSSSESQTPLNENPIRVRGDRGELSSLSHPIQEPHSRVGICEAKVGICLYIVLLTKVFWGVNDPVW